MFENRLQIDCNHHQIVKSLKCQPVSLPLFILFIGQRPQALVRERQRMVVHRVRRRGGWFTEKGGEFSLRVNHGESGFEEKWKFELVRIEISIGGKKLFALLQLLAR